MSLVEPAEQNAQGFDVYKSGGVPHTMGDKISIVSYNEQDPGACTFCIRDEDHTLGNSLRYMIMKKYHQSNRSPAVVFCGYSTDNSMTALECFHKGLDDLMDLCAHVKQEFRSKLDEHSANK